VEQLLRERLSEYAYAREVAEPAALALLERAKHDDALLEPLERMLGEGGVLSAHGVRMVRDGVRQVGRGAAAEAAERGADVADVEQLLRERLSDPAYAREVAQPAARSPRRKAKAAAEAAEAETAERRGWGVCQCKELLAALKQPDAADRAEGVLRELLVAVQEWPALFVPLLEELATELRACLRPDDEPEQSESPREQSEPATAPRADLTESDGPDDGACDKRQAAALLREDRQAATLLRKLLDARRPLSDRPDLKEQREYRTRLFGEPSVDSRRYVLGGDTRAKCARALREWEASETVAAALQASEQRKSDQPPSAAQIHLDNTFGNPLDYENWYPPLKQWAMRYGLLKHWPELDQVPGGDLMHAQNTLTALLPLFELRVGGEVVAHPASCEDYGQQVPGPGRDVRELLVRGFWWLVRGEEYVFLGCRDSARQLAYLLHRFGIYLPHSPPKDGDLALSFNFFLDPDVHLAVPLPTEAVCRLELILVRRVVANKKAAQKFASAATSRASAADFPHMDLVQFKALQRWPNDALVHIADPTDPYTFTPADPSSLWAATLSLRHKDLDLGDFHAGFPREMVLRDAGAGAVDEEAWRAHAARPVVAEPRRQRGDERGDPASHPKHYEGNEYTRCAPRNSVHLTCYSNSRPDPRRPAGFTRPTNQSMGVTLLFQGRAGKPLLERVRQCGETSGESQSSTD